jgi:rhodanese-related sulfurtransferase
MQDLTVFISQHLMLAYAFALILVLLMVVEFFRQKRQQIRIGVTDAVRLMNHERAVVIDIRTKEQFRAGHIIDALSFQERDLMENPKKLDKFRIKPVIITCGTGQESQKVAAYLLKQGYNIYSLAGGMRAWNEAEMPIVKESNG